MPDASSPCERQKQQTNSKNGQRAPMTPFRLANTSESALFDGVDAFSYEFFPVLHKSANYVL